MKMVFDKAEALKDWRAVNDSVMGGLSEGTVHYADGHMVFSGALNTEGGGFSSIRTPVPPGIYAKTQGMKLRVRSDDRTYKLSIRTSLRYRGRQIAFQAPLNIPKTKQWTDISLDFSELIPTLFGQALSGAVFAPETIEEVGFIIADGKNGPFQLDIQSIDGIVVP